MKKLGLILLAALVSAPLADAKSLRVHTTDRNYGIYGWDVACVGGHGLKVRASQSDDDFYITYKSNTLKRTVVWADNDSYDLRNRVLLFITTEPNSQGHHVALSFSRSSLNRFDYAEGKINIEGATSKLNCFVRYGRDEDAFSAVVNQPFPHIPLPQEF